MPVEPNLNRIRIIKDFLIVHMCSSAKIAQKIGDTHRRVMMLSALSYPKIKMYKKFDGAPHVHSRILFLVKQSILSSRLTAFSFNRVCNIII